MERLKMMKEQLMSAVQSELGRLDQADAKELGEVVDMIKDLSEAVYYCTIVKSMEETEKEGKKEYRYYPMPMDYAQGDGNGNRNYPYYRDMDREYGRMYYDGSGSGNSGGQSSGSRSYQDGNRQSPGESRNYPIEIRDYREGQSPLTRKTYMERKMHGGDKAAQMQELEKYMQELGRDLTEMVEGSSSEEKQMLKQKIQTLATKIV